MFNLSIDDAFKRLKASKEGLKKEEITKRQEKFGLNVLPEQKPTSWVVLLLSQINSALIYILIIAAGISFGLVWHEHGGITFKIADQADTYIILMAVLINVVVGFVQESRAQKSLQALK